MYWHRNVVWYISWGWLDHGKGTVCVWGHPLVWSETRFMLALKIYTGLGLSKWCWVWNSGKRHLIPRKEKCFLTKYNGDVRDVCVLWMKYVHAASVLPAEMRKNVEQRCFEKCLSVFCPCMGKTNWNILLFCSAEEKNEGLHEDV